MNEHPSVSLLGMGILLSMLLVAGTAQDVETTLSSQLITSLGSFPCTRLLSTTTDIGCSTDQGGITGLLFPINNDQDTATFLSLSSSSTPRAVLITPSMVSLQTLSTLSSQPYFAGLVVLPGPLDPTVGFSPESRVLPKGRTPGYVWNPPGRNLIYTRFNFPIVTVGTEEAATLSARAAKNIFNGVDSFPQWAVHFSYFMGPPGLTSRSCLDSGSCLPLGGQSVWGAMGPLDSAPPIVSPPGGGGSGGVQGRFPSLLGLEGSLKFQAMQAGGGGVGGIGKQQGSGGVNSAPRSMLEEEEGRAEKKVESAESGAAKKTATAGVKGGGAKGGGEGIIEIIPHYSSPSSSSSSSSSSARSSRDGPVNAEKRQELENVRRRRILAASAQSAGSSGGGIEDDDTNTDENETASVGMVQRPIIMAVTAMDSSALFHDLALGADSAVSGIVALLAAADCLSRTDFSGLPHQILFGLFQAEQWGRIGSRRWVDEVRGFTCLSNVSAGSSPTGRAYCSSPLRTDLAALSSLSMLDISYVIAVDQVGRPGLDALFVHEYDLSPSPPSNRTYEILKALGGTIPVAIQQAQGTVAPPPTPLLSFQDPDGGGPPLSANGAVLSGYDAAFANRYFHSQFDDASNVDTASIAAAATTLARGLYALATNATTPAGAAALVPHTLISDIDLVTQMVHCITVNARCPLFASVLGVDVGTLATLVPAGPLSLYTGVYNQPYVLPNNGYVLQPTPLEAFVRNSLGYSSATQRGGPCTNTPDCQALLGKAYECLVGTCVIANSFYHDALSPALSSTPASNVYSVDDTKVDEKDPLWTEPYWSVNIGSTGFLKDSALTEGAALGAGIACVLASFIGSYFLVSYLDSNYKVT